jgi:hypothetical protein
MHADERRQDANKQADRMVVFYLRLSACICRQFFFLFTRRKSQRDEGPRQKASSDALGRKEKARRDVRRAFPSTKKGPSGKQLNPR